MCMCVTSKLASALGLFLCQRAGYLSFVVAGVGGGFVGFLSFVSQWGIYVFQIFNIGLPRQEA